MNVEKNYGCPQEVSSCQGGNAAEVLELRLCFQKYLSG